MRFKQLTDLTQQLSTTISRDDNGVVKNGFYFEAFKDGNKTVILKSMIKNGLLHPQGKLITAKTNEKAASILIRDAKNVINNAISIWHLA